MTSFTLPWPDADLAGNSRAHWAVRNRKFQKAKNWAIQEALAAGMQTCKDPQTKFSLFFDLHPPKQSRADKDNYMTACKAYQDGIAHRLGVDDGRFDTNGRRHSNTKGAGYVRVTISELETGASA